MSENLQTYIDNGNFMKKIVGLQGLWSRYILHSYTDFILYSNHHKVALLGVENLPLLSSLRMSVKSNGDDDDES